MSTYLETLTYIYTYPQYNPNDISDWSLRRVRDLLARLGNPHQAGYRTILLAGSKGKGSTAAICEAMLRAGGYQTGLYCSPQLHSFRERIQLTGALISEELLVEIVNQHRAEFEATEGLTAFELTTVLAFLAFAKAKVDVAVIEVGLGGRDDVTNVVAADVAVLTPISYNHTNILGNTLTEIATIKSGIIRPGQRVVMAPQTDEARQVIEAVCTAQGAQLSRVSEIGPWRVEQANLSGQMFWLADELYYLPLLGQHQVENGLTALTTVRQLAEVSGLPISTGAIREGLAEVKWPGRFELLNEEPYLLVDSAVNRASMVRLRDTVAEYLPDLPLTVIFGASADHAIAEMLAVLCPIAERLIAVASHHPRAASPAQIAAQAKEQGYAAEIAPSVEAAINMAMNNGPLDQVVCVTGSLFLVADARRTWLTMIYQPLPVIDPVVMS